MSRKRNSRQRRHRRLKVEQLETRLLLTGGAEFVHTGATDPLTEGWSLFDNPANTATLSRGTDAQPFWEIDATTNSNRQVFYFVDETTPDFPDALNDPLGWTFTVTARVEQGIDYGPGAAGGGFSAFANHQNLPSFTVIDGDIWGFSLIQANVAGGTNVAGAYYQSSFQVEPVLLQELDITQYHDYELRMNRGAGGAASDTVSHFIDGALVATLSRSDVFNFDRTRASFGDANSFVGGSIARYHSVQFSAGNTPEPANSPPVPQTDVYLTNFDAPLVVDGSAMKPSLLANDSDPEGDPLTVVSVTQPAHGAVAFNADGTFSYAPLTEFFANLPPSGNSEDHFTYTVSDGTETATADVFINVLNVIDPPPPATPPALARDDQALTDEDTPVTINVVANDRGTSDGTVKEFRTISDSEGTPVEPVDFALDDNDGFASSIANIGDLDLDGVTDLVVGAPRDDDGGAHQQANRGAVYVLFMNADGTVREFQKISDTEGTEETPQEFTLADGDSFGNSVANIGDLDNDGITDIAVGAPFDGGGAVYVLFLNRNGTVKSFQKISDDEGTPGSFSLNSGDRFGSSVANLGDLDGDTIPDIAVGASGDGVPNIPDVGHRGAVYVLFLNRDGTAKEFRKISDDEGTPEAFSLSALDGFGLALASLGDLDGDRIPELAVGAQADELVYVLFLKLDGAHVVRSFREISASTLSVDRESSVGSLAALGDLDGDGVSDLAAGVFDSGGTSLGARVLFLNSNGTVKGVQEISDSEGIPASFSLLEKFAGSLASMGDLNGDGVSDLAVGAFSGAGGQAVYLAYLDPGQPITAVDGQAVIVDTPVTIDSGALVTLQADGTLAYDPNGRFEALAVGETAGDNFTYTVTAAAGNTDSATVFVTIHGRNDPPVATDFVFEAREDGPPVFHPFLGADDESDDDASTMTYEILSQPSAGLVTNNHDGTFRFDPPLDAEFQQLAAGQTRDVAFRYAATDHHGAVSAPGAITARIVGTNDAPEVLADGTFFTAISEDSLDNFGQRVADLLGDTVMDVDNDSLRGLAIVHTNNGNGTWQYSLDAAGTWSDVGDVSQQSALLLAADNWVRFVPDGARRDVAFIDYRAWDQTSGDSGGRGDVSRHGGSTAFSTSIASVRIETTDVNDAPVLDASFELQLEPVAPGDTDPAGMSVTDLLTSGGGAISDVDRDAQTGIAVTYVDSFFGVWRYSTDGGASWNDFGEPTSGAARLLAAHEAIRIRYIPQADSTESSFLRFRAWDQTGGGASGSTADTFGNGGSSAFSAEVGRANIDVAFAVPPRDDGGDSDGVADEMEDGAPNNGDGNGDGIPDRNQAHVASLQGSPVHPYVTVASPLGTTLVDVRLADRPPDAPAEASFPFGYLFFEVHGVPVGGSVDVTLFFEVEPNPPLNGYFKFGPERPGDQHHWFDFERRGPGPGADILGNIVTLHLVDGQRGDDDLTANGVIVDPGAPVIDYLPWHNRAEPRDVNHDGQVTPNDVLRVINQINAIGAKRLGIHDRGPEDPSSDVNGDGFLTPMDAIIIVNYLNVPRDAGEGESPSDIHREALTTTLDAIVLTPGMREAGRRTVDTVLPNRESRSTDPDHDRNGLQPPILPPGGVLSKQGARQSSREWYFAEEYPSRNDLALTIALGELLAEQASG